MSITASLRLKVMSSHVPDHTDNFPFLFSISCKNTLCQAVMCLMKTKSLVETRCKISWKTMTAAEDIPQFPVFSQHTH